MKEQASVLVVDDNSDLLNTFSLILKMKGYNVDTAEDGVSAVDKFKRRPFDVILMDLIMPRMNGVEAFRKIREINPGARIILMTAYYEEGQIKMALDEGAYRAVHKPVNVARLMEMIGEATLSSPVLIVDDDGDFLIDCEDSDCTNTIFCVEICDNLHDDNANGLIDCEDPQCFGSEDCGEERDSEAPWLSYSRLWLCRKQIEYGFLWRQRLSYPCPRSASFLARKR